MTDFSDDDLLAGEYVLGTLDHRERVAASLRRATDRPFDTLVTGWEQRLTPLVEDIRERDPPAHLWGAIVSRVATLMQTTAPSGATVLRLRRQVSAWRGAAAGMTALAACLAAWSVIAALRPQQPAPALIAVLQKTDEAAGFVVRANLGARSLSVQPLTGSPPAGKVYELWVIDPSIGAPKSLGVLGAASTSRAVLPDVPRETLERATYAVTAEAPGGAPEGKPTSAPVFIGHLLRFDP